MARTVGSRKVASAIVFAAMIVGCGGVTSGPEKQVAVGGAGDVSAGGSSAGGTASAGAGSGGATSNTGGATTVVQATIGDVRCPPTWTNLTDSAGFPVVCTMDGLVCTYPEGQGECAPDGNVLKWWQVGFSPGCPEFVPKMGTTCTSPGTSCGYITGPPSGDYVTNSCCDGNSLLWAIQPSDGCPNGTTCGSIRAADYDQTCTTDSDCVGVVEGNLCLPNMCSDCTNAAVSTKAQAQYEADFANKDSTPTICPCPLGPAAVCKNGVCGVGL
jgi:hypothetical protein